MQRPQILLVILALFFTEHAYSQITKSVEGQAMPLWEAGAGLVNAIVPAYPGSEDSNNFHIPFPVFFYRGEVLRADEEGGMRGRFLKKETFEINLSIGGSLPASSDNVHARRGMPDIKTITEFGPGLLATLWRKRGINNYKLGLNIPLRSAFAVDFWKVEETGIVFNPLLYLITENVFGNRVLSFTSLSSFVGSAKFQRNFYQVDPQYVLDDRPAYNAGGGYLGSTISQGFSKLLFKQVNVFLGVSYTYLGGARNIDSPLIKRKGNFSGALGFVWWFWESKRREAI